MPVYTLNCLRDAHAFTVPMSVALFRARRDEAAGNRGMFKHIQCPRCKRKGTCVHDAIGDMRTQSTHDGNYTFYENAPDEILQGQHERTVSNTEAKALMKEFGVADAGKEGKREFPQAGSKKEAIKLRWKAEEGERLERERLERLRLAAEKAAEPPPAVVEMPPEVALGVKQSSTDCTVLVDNDFPPVDTIAAMPWRKLRQKAKKLKVVSYTRLKRPELEAAVREMLELKAAE
jgi:hypothetical protein